MDDEILQRAATLARQRADHKIADQFDSTIRDHVQGVCPGVDQRGACYRERMAREYLAEHEQPAPVDSAADGPFVHVGSHEPHLNVWDNKTGDQLCMASRPEYAREIEAAVNAYRARPVVDSELRDRIAAAFDNHEWAGGDHSNHPLEDFVAVAVAAVTPALKKAYLDGHDSGYAAANVADPWAEQQPVADGEIQEKLAAAIHDSDAWFNHNSGPRPVDFYRELAASALAVVAPVLAARDAQTLEIARLLGTSVDENGLEHGSIINAIRLLREVKDDLKGATITLTEQREKLTSQLEFEQATKQQYAEEAQDLRAEIAKAHELLLALGADTDWPHPPPSLPDRIHLLRLDLQATGMNFAEIQRQLAEMLAADEETAIPDLLALARDQLDVLAGAIEPHGECRPECDCGDHRGPGSCGCHVTGEEAREWIRRLESERETLLCTAQPDSEDIELTAMLKDRSTEPRVWRKGDPEPPDSIQVLVDCKDDHLPYLCRIPGTEWWQWFDRPADRGRAPGGVPWDEATSVMGSSKKDYLVPLPGFSEVIRDSPAGGDTELDPRTWQPRKDHN